eukprot:g4628.t1
MKTFNFFLVFSYFFVHIVCIELKSNSLRLVDASMKENLSIQPNNNDAKELKKDVAARRESFDKVDFVNQNRKENSSEILDKRFGADRKMKEKDTARWMVGSVSELTEHELGISEHPGVVANLEALAAGHLQLAAAHSEEANALLTNSPEEDTTKNHSAESHILKGKSHLSYANSVIPSPMDEMESLKKTIDPTFREWRGQCQLVIAFEPAVVTPTTQNMDEETREKHVRENCIKLLADTVSSELYDSLRNTEKRKFIKTSCEWTIREYRRFNLTDSLKDLQVKPLSMQRRNLPQAIICAKLSNVLVGIKRIARLRAFYRIYDCSQESVENQCGGKNGICVDHDDGKPTCYCRKGFTGIACSSRTCPKPCGRHAFCVGGSCQCLPGFAGADCKLIDCPKTQGKRCAGHGICKAGTDTNSGQKICMCMSGWSGVGCESRYCPFGLNSNNIVEQCSGHGHCNVGDGTCECQHGFEGVNCSICNDDTKNNRTCTAKKNLFGEGPMQTCKCHAGYFGACCGRVACQNNCNGHGKCDGSSGQCICDDGYFGIACASKVPQCPVGQKEGEKSGMPCSGRGICRPLAQKETEGNCICPVGWIGDACEKPDPCPMNCLSPSRGECVNDGKETKCKCKPGYEGKGCQKKTVVPKKCVESCGEKCLHFSGKDCKLDPSFQGDFQNLDPSAPLPTSLLELQSQSQSKEGLEVSCYWKCTRQCLEDDCLRK